MTKPRPLQCFNSQANLTWPYGLKQKVKLYMLPKNRHELILKSVS
jgi:hypothetical protein